MQGRGLLRWVKAEELHLMRLPGTTWVPWTPVLNVLGFFLLLRPYIPTTKEKIGREKKIDQITEEISSKKTNVCRNLWVLIAQSKKRYLYPPNHFTVFPGPAGEASSAQARMAVREGLLLAGLHHQHLLPVLGVCLADPRHPLLLYPHLGLSNLKTWVLELRPLLTCVVVV